ncbi:DUF4932 domain-containing protein [Mucilaginibacter pedocola]|nr:DUF4932 domain-containing protein [Mucilaginibacter pedocola]
MKKLLTICLLSMLPLLAVCQEKLTVKVHPGVELFTIIQILAEKYPQPNPSAYSKEALEYFGKFKEHPAVKKVQSFGNTYTDLVELGWCMSDFPNIKIYEPTGDVNWYKMYGKENVLEYIKLCRDFFNDTKFWDFYQQHLPSYTTWGNQMKHKLDSVQYIKNLQDFYRYNADVKWYICIDPLNSWGSHAIMTKTLNPQFSDLLVYNTGYFTRGGKPDADPVFEFKDFENLVWHEGSHVYVNTLLKEHEKEIDALEYLFNKDDDGQKRNNISTWRYCFDETLVRSITAALYKKYRTERLYKRQLAKETLSDFIYVDELAPFIYNNYINSNKYKNFTEFFPQVLKFLKEKHPQPGK